MDAAQFREAAHATIEKVIYYFENLHKSRVTPDLKPGFLQPQLPDEAPQEGEAWQKLLTDVSNKIEPGLTHWQHPNFFAFFPANVTYPSILGEIYSAAYNAPAFNWLCSPVCTELETVVMDWLAKALALPTCFLSNGEGGGVIQGSASEASIVAMIAARERYVRRELKKRGFLEAAEDNEERQLEREDAVAEIQGKLVALASDQAHSLAQKAANVLGLRYRSVAVSLENRLSMTGANVREQLAKVRKQGLRPFFLLVTLGTTGTCAFDDLEEVAAIRRENPDIWVHVDAAWAGSALICPELRDECLAGHLDAADSLDLNMHKWMLTNFDASCMFVQKRVDLTSALTIARSYLENPDSLAGEKITDYRDWQLPLGRRFRALKIWFVFRTYGVSGIQKVIRSHVAYAETFAALCRSEAGRTGGLVVVSGPVMCLTVIRCVDPGAVASPTGANGINGADGQQTGSAVAIKSAEPSVTAASNANTRRVAGIINDSGRFYITLATVGDVQCIRVVGANPQTSEDSYRQLFECLVETNRAVHAGV